MRDLLENLSEKKCAGLALNQNNDDLSKKTS